MFFYLDILLKKIKDYQYVEMQNTHVMKKNNLHNSKQSYHNYLYVSKYTK